MIGAWGSIALCMMSRPSVVPAGGIFVALLCGSSADILGLIEFCDFPQIQGDEIGINAFSPIAMASGRTGWISPDHSGRASARSTASLPRTWRSGGRHPRPGDRPFAKRGRQIGGERVPMTSPDMGVRRALRIRPTATHPTRRRAARREQNETCRRLLLRYTASGLAKSWGPSNNQSTIHVLSRS